jgi:plastocyanin
MRRVAIFFALIGLLTLPAVAVAAGAFQAASSDPAADDYQMGSGVTIVDFAFQPSYIVVPSGGTVSWYNAGGAPHTATSSTGAFDSGTLNPGGGFSTTFWTPGTYSYYCAIHPSMVGTVQVS